MSGRMKGNQVTMEFRQEGLDCQLAWAVRLPL